MGNRLVPLLLLALLGIVHAQLWLGRGSVPQVNALKQQLSEQEQLNRAAQWRNEQLASEVNMSVSAFHHNFKAVTSTSPLQYLKSYRLHKARMMMIHDGMKASAAAMRVGYESASQFSREFKRFFGVTPGRMQPEFE